MATRKVGSERQPVFFRSLEAFRRWLAAHHTGDELWVGLYKRQSGETGISYKESVDAALAYGWIDGIRKTIDGTSYRIRFTPRRKTSIWSAINLKRVRELEKLGLMAEPGLIAYRDRDPRKQNLYSFENRPRQLPPRYAKQFQKDRTAFTYFQSQPPWYRRTTTWWVLSAKQEETRLRRLGILMEHCGKGLWIGALKRPGRKSTPEG